MEKKNSAGRGLTKVQKHCCVLSMAFVTLQFPAFIHQARPVFNLTFARAPPPYVPSKRTPDCHRVEKKLIEALVRWSCMTLNRQVPGQWIMHPILNKLVWAPRFRNEPIHCRTVPCEAGRLSCVRYFTHCLDNEIWANGCSNLICYENNRSFSFNWMLWFSNPRNTHRRCGWKS